MDELLEQFLAEGQELVQQAVADLLALERAGFDAAHTDSAFRAIHTLKGSVGLFDLAPMGLALHAAEDLMAGLRQEARLPGRDAMDALLGCMGEVETWLGQIDADGRLPADAQARAQQLVASMQAAREIRPSPGDRAVAAQPDWLRALLDDPAGPRASAAFRYLPDPGCFFVGDDPLALVRAVPELLALRLQPRAAWSLDDYDPFACNLAISGLSGATPQAVSEAFRLVADQLDIRPLAASVADAGDLAHIQPGVQPEGSPRGATRFLRVNASRIDGLAALVGELFVAKTRLAHIAGTGGEAASNGHGRLRDLAQVQAELDRLAGAMHRAVTAIRMVPLDQTLRRLPRLVRETAGRLGKEVRFSVEGAQIQADTAVVDALFEPLLHLLRNAIDHGIEPPDTRRAAGKPGAGHIALRAWLEGDEVRITLADDGAGIDAGALREAALSRGLASAERLAAMDDDDAIELVFLPGFSTAGQVTDTSGRGVGLDAVRASLQAIGGDVALSPASGGGTLVRLAVPQSLALVGLMTVQAAGATFGVPLDLVEETARVPRSAFTSVQSGRAVVLRDRTLPLLALGTLLGKDAPEVGDYARLLIVAIGDQRIGLEVDGFGARLEAVVQPLPALLAGLAGLRGTALLGDGSVLAVLDVAELVG